MNKAKSTLLTAILTFAALYAFSCSGDDNVNGASSSSSVSGTPSSSSISPSSSSFVLVSSSSLSSSSSETLSSSSEVFSSSSIIIDILDAVQEPEKYTTKDSVAAYIHKFKKLPSNYVNKATGQSMYEQEGYTFERWNFNPLQVLGVMIGGDYFGNNEGLLPSGDYKECDVDYHDSSRGTKRLVYTNAGIVHYTANHYETFTLIYE